MTKREFFPPTEFNSVDAEAFVSARLARLGNVAVAEVAE